MERGIDRVCGSETDASPPGGTLVLPPMLDGLFAETLGRQLQDRVLAGLPLLLDGGSVERVSTMCVQVLVAAAQGARTRGLRFGLSTPSAALQEAVDQLGLGKALVALEGTV